MLCDHLEGWDREGGRETQEGGDSGFCKMLQKNPNELFGQPNRRVKEEEGRTEITEDDSFKNQS